MAETGKWKKIKEFPFIEEVLKKSESISWTDVPGNVCCRHSKLEIKPKYSKLIEKKVSSEIKDGEHKDYYIYAKKNCKKNPKLIFHGTNLYWLDLKKKRVCTAKIPYHDIRMDWRRLVVFLERPLRFY